MLFLSIAVPSQLTTPALVNAISKGCVQKGVLNSAQQPLPRRPVTVVVYFKV